MLFASLLFQIQDHFYQIRSIHHPYITQYRDQLVLIDSTSALSNEPIGTSKFSIHFFSQGSLLLYRKFCLTWKNIFLPSSLIGAIDVAQSRAFVNNFSDIDGQKFMSNWMNEYLALSVIFLNHYNTLIVCFHCVNFVSWITTFLTFSKNFFPFYSVCCFCLLWL